MRDANSYLREVFTFSLGEDSLPVAQQPLRILFQPYHTRGACGLLDAGYISGFREAGAQVVVWDPVADRPPLQLILHRFRPTHFIGYMQRQDRQPVDWITSSTLQILLEYRQRQGLKVAVNSFPSNLCDFYGAWLQETGLGKDQGPTFFYAMPERPTPSELELLQTGFVDLITSRDCVENAPLLYRNFRDLGFPVLVEPPAAASRYFDSPDQNEEDIDLLFVGGCWPFKWHNMKNYIPFLKDRFGESFQIYGRSWPDCLSKGELEERYADFACRAKINLAFHEPSQVRKQASSTNERVFKLLSMGRFVISDPCTAHHYYFREGRDLIMAGGGQEMTEKAEYYLEHPELRVQIGRSGREHVLQYHTYRKRAERVLWVLENLRDRVFDFK